APDDGDQLLMHERARLRVERPERLVHQQDRRLDRQRARDGDALLHAARELRRETVLEALEVDEVDQLLRALLAFGARPALLLQAVKDVLPHRLPRVEREILEDDAAVGPGAGNRTPGDGDAPRLDRQEAAKEIEQRALAAAARPEQRDELLLAHIERDAVERQHRLAARRTIGVAHRAEGDTGVRHACAALNAAVLLLPSPATGRRTCSRRSRSSAGQAPSG